MKTLPELDITVPALTPFFPVSMAVITTIRSAFGFLTRLPVGPWPLQNDLNGFPAWLPLVGLVVGGLRAA